MKKIFMNNKEFTKRDDVIAFGFEAKRIAKEFDTVGKPALVEDMTSKGLLVHSAGIATAIIKGKWNLSEYPTELTPLLEKYNINPEVRGIH